MESPFTSVSVTRSYEQIVKQIHDAIRSGSLARGARLPTERELSDTFGVSRSVVREAVKVLAAQGIVESRQGSGTYVVDSPAPFVSRTIMLDVPMEESAIEQLIEFREVLDTLAAHRAALHRSDDQLAEIFRAVDLSLRGAETDDLQVFAEGDLLFHSLIDQAAANVYIAIASSSVRQTQSEMSRLYASQPGSFMVASSQHRAIAEAIRDQDAPRAEHLMREHVRYSGSFLLQIPKDISITQTD
ncbi:MAG: FadR/GntR family transcriptional regulator [Thermomicrobiales bacterium]